VSKKKNKRMCGPVLLHIPYLIDGENRTLGENYTNEQPSLERVNA
jgi:hypothetical protein